MVDDATSFGGSTVGYAWAYDTPQSLKVLCFGP